MYDFIPLLIPFLVVVAVIVATVIVPLLSGRRQIDINPALVEFGLEIPVYNVELGSLFFRKNNNFGLPYFILFTNKVKFKARNQTFSWSLKTLFRTWIEKEVMVTEIQIIRYESSFLAGHFLILQFYNNGPSLKVQLNKYNLKGLLRFFQDKGCFLNPEAQNFLSIQNY
jgi:hypothetical protein